MYFNPNTASNTNFHKTGVLTVHGGSVMSAYELLVMSRQDPGSGSQLNFE